MLTPEQIAAKWSRSAQAAGTSYREGVQAVTRSPTAKAAARADAWAAGVQRAAAEGSFQRGLQRVSLEDWKAAAITKGAPRFTSGIQAAEPKFASFMREFTPHLNTVLSELEGMPRGDLEQNLARMNHVARRNAEFRRSR
jgi:hypothetical protein